MRKTQQIAGLELGARRFTAAVGEMQEGQRLVIRAVESIPAQGFEREGLTDPIECSDTVARLLRQLERTLSDRVTLAAVAFPSIHLKAANASTSVPITDPGTGVSRADAEKVIHTCRALSIDYDRQILHTFERGFSVDGQSGIRNPVGLSGKKLSVELHLITAQSATAQNLTKVINRAGLELDSFVLPGLGAAEAVLSDLDRDLGVTLIRVGESQTEVILFNDGQVRETFLVPGGVEDLVEALSRSFKLPRISAEHLLEQVRTLEEQPAVVGADGQGRVVQLVRGRAKDLLTRIQRRLVTSSTFLDSASGIVVVGYLARLEGFLEMAEEMFNMPVRLGTVKEMELPPGYPFRMQDVTALGLVRYSFNRRASAGAHWNLPPWLKPLEKFQRILQEYF